MIQDVLSFATCFELNNSPANVEVTDDTPYAAEGIALSDVEGFFTMTGPDGVKFHTGVISPPDIDADVSLVFAGAQLPLDASGEVQKGTYTIRYDIVVSGAVQPGSFFIEKQFSFTYEAPVVQLDIVVDCRCSSLVSSDVTSYGTPTSLVRTHTVHPPTGVDSVAFPDTVSSNAVVTVTPITDKTWSSEVSTVLQFDFADGLCVKDTVTGAEENKVECDISLCDIFCCIKTVADKFFALQGVNDFEAANVKRDQLDPVMILVALHDKAITCGQDKLAAKYFAQILDISKCAPECSCTDDKPTVIVPICGTVGTGGDTVVVVCGNGAITLQTVVLGNETTYTLCFDQALLDKLNALFNTTLIAGTGISINAVINPVTGDIAYTITNPSQPTNQHFLRLEIDFDTPGLPVFTILNENIVGTKFLPAVLDFKNSSNSLLFANQNNEFEVKEFLAAADPFAGIIGIESVDFIIPTLAQTYAVQIMSSSTAANGSIKFTIFDFNGAPMSGSQLISVLDKVILTLNINSI